MIGKLYTHPEVLDRMADELGDLFGGGGDGEAVEEVEEVEVVRGFLLTGLANYF
jgi:hypothetical protein